jgi:large subunit ribosomal protein L13
MEKVIDATGKSIGRLSTEVAATLLAKDSVKFAKNVVAQVTVRVTNASKVSIDPKKYTGKTYHSHSGYPGSDRKRTLAQVIDKKGHADAIRRAVSGMLPKNTLRERRLKRLIIEA